MLGPLRLLVDVVKAGYQVATKMPRITCNIRSVYNARWSPDFFSDEHGNVEGEGIRIEACISILLDNSGGADTTLKDIYVVCKSHRKQLGRLSCYAIAKDKNRQLAGIIVEPRRIWGPETLEIVGSLWDIDRPPKDLEATLVVEVVAQRPVKKKIKFYF